MKILLDTNVILDVFLKRQPFYEMSKAVMDLVQYAEFDEYISASAVTDIYYITNRSLKDAEATRALIVKMLTAVHIVAVTEDEIKAALHLSWKDFEDAVQYSVASSVEMDGIITRNKGDYSQSALNVWSPQEFMDLLPPH